MRNLSKHLGTGRQGQTGSDPKRERSSAELPEGSGAPRDESTFIYRVLEVAHGLRYRSLEHLIGRKFTVHSEASAEQDFAEAIGEYLDSSRIGERLLPIGTGTHRAYGFLDLALPAKIELAESSLLRGIPLLRELGFLTREEEGPFLCPHDFEVLVSDIRKGEACLRLLAQDEAWRSRARTWWRKGGRTSPAEYQPVFPLRFKIVDAGITNSSYVWRWKHFYW